jgi:hypothetical protein
MASETATLGAAGEHYVLFQLLRRGFIAALAPHGVPMADIIVTDDVGKRLCAIQVKTRRAIGSDGGWHMKDKHEDLKSSTVFYCFVDVGKSHNDTPSCYVVPSPIVARVLSVSHQCWLATPGAKGQPRNQSPMRRFLPDYAKRGLPDCAKGWLDEYREAWDLLKA